MKKGLIALVLFLAVASSAPAAETEFREFFEEWVALEHAFDPALIERYSDDALIRLLRRASDGSGQTLELGGRQWKELLRSTLDVAKRRGDRSEYSEVTVAVSDAGNRATIYAARYSTLKCFTDSAFYLVVERSDAGLTIVEEYGESTVESLCDQVEQPQDLELMIEASVRVANSQLELPILVDEEMRLDAIRAAGKTLEYQFVLVNYAAEEMDPEALLQNLRPGVVLQVCSRPSLKPLLERGASVVFQYRGKDGKDVATLPVTNADCEESAPGEAPRD